MVWADRPGTSSPGLDVSRGGRSDTKIQFVGVTVRILLMFGYSMKRYLSPRLVRVELFPKSIRTSRLATESSQKPSIWPRFAKIRKLSVLCEVTVRICAKVPP